MSDVPTLGHRDAEVVLALPDDGALREREKIAETLHDADEGGMLCGTWPCDKAEKYRVMADAVLAALPSPAEAFARGVAWATGDDYESEVDR